LIIKKYVYHHIYIAALIISIYFLYLPFIKLHINSFYIIMSSFELLHIILTIEGKLPLNILNNFVSYAIFNL